MSIGNTKDYGNKGNNFPYQKAVLDGLSLGQFSNLKEVALDTTDYGTLENKINDFFLVLGPPNAYLVSKSIVFNGTKWVAFITYRVK